MQMRHFIHVYTLNALVEVLLHVNHQSAGGKIPRREFSMKLKYKELWA